jgi:peptide/nickel transport system permease protein
MGKPYLALVPGVAIMLLVSSFMMIGNSLRDRFDPMKS